MSNEGTSRSKLFAAASATGFLIVAAFYLLRPASTSAEPVVAIFAAVAAMELLSIGRASQGLNRWAFNSAAIAAAAMVVENGGSVLQAHAASYALLEGSLFGAASILLCVAAAMRRTTSERR